MTRGPHHSKKSRGMDNWIRRLGETSGGGSYASPARSLGHQAIDA